MPVKRPVTARRARGTPRTPRPRHALPDRTAEPDVAARWMTRSQPLAEKNITWQKDPELQSLPHLLVFLPQAFQDPFSTSRISEASRAS
jgi:hypothetical protein